MLETRQFKSDRDSDLDVLHLSFAQSILPLAPSLT